MLGTVSEWKFMEPNVGYYRYIFLLSHANFLISILVGVVIILCDTCWNRLPMSQQHVHKQKHTQKENNTK